MGKQGIPNIFNYFEYREFVRDYYEMQKNEHAYFSYRYFSLKLQVDPGTLLKVTQAKAHLSATVITRLIQYLHLDEKESAYLETLVLFNKAKTENESKKFYEALIRQKDIDYRTLNELEYQYFSEWYHIPVRAIIGMQPFDENFAALGQKVSPKISEEQAKESFILLQKLGLIKKNAQGLWELHESVVSTGTQWRSHAIRNYQKLVIEKAAESLERYPKEKRDVSTVTVAINMRDLPAFQMRCEEFRRELMKMAVDSEEPDSVYQINIQLFPMGFKDVQ